MFYVELLALLLDFAWINLSTLVWWILLNPLIAWLTVMSEVIFAIVDLSFVSLFFSSFFNSILKSAMICSLLLVLVVVSLD